MFKHKELFEANCEPDEPNSQGVKIAVGVILSVVFTGILAFFAYRQVSKQKAREAAMRGSTLSGGAATYKRMQSDTDMAFALGDENLREEKGVYKGERNPFAMSNPSSLYRD